MNPKPTGIILASGEGSRLKQTSESMGVPKHLFQIGSDTLVTRSAKELLPNCSEVYCVVPQNKKGIFEKAFQNHQLEIHVIEKNGSGFAGDFTTLVEIRTTDQVILTLGDLIFPDGVLDAFCKKVQKNPSNLVVTLDQNRIKHFKFPTIIDFRMVAFALPQSVLKNLRYVNPENFFSIMWFLFRFLTVGKVSFKTLPVLFNVNTPEEYNQAKAFFK